MGIPGGRPGGFSGVELAALVNGFIEKQGGIHGIVSQFEKQGLGGIARSWVATGANEVITSGHIHQVFGAEVIRRFAANLGLPADQVASALAEILPKTIDRMTPQGEIAA